jgi:hypothetical protein
MNSPSAQDQKHAAAGAAQRHVSIKQSDQGQVLELSNIVFDPDSSCVPFDDFGVVVKRNFADDAVSLKEIVIERDDGTRSLINVKSPVGLTVIEQGLFSGCRPECGWNLLGEISR